MAESPYSGMKQLWCGAQAGDAESTDRRVLIAAPISTPRRVRVAANAHQATEQSFCGE